MVTLWSPTGYIADVKATVQTLIDSYGGVGTVMIPARYQNGVPIPWPFEADGDYKLDFPAGINIKGECEPCPEWRNSYTEEPWEVEDCSLNFWVADCHNDLVVAGAGSTIYRNLNEGAGSFTAVGSVPGATPIEGIFIDSQENVYASGRGGAGIYRCTNIRDASPTWTLLSLPGTTGNHMFTNLDFFEYNNVLYVGLYYPEYSDHASVYYSTNWGATWYLLHDFGQGHVHAFRYNQKYNKMWVWIGDPGQGAFGIYYSKNMGADWTKLTVTDGGGNMPGYNCMSLQTWENYLFCTKHWDNGQVYRLDVTEDGSGDPPLNPTVVEVYATGIRCQNWVWFHEGWALTGGEGDPGETPTLAVAFVDDYDSGEWWTLDDNGSVSSGRVGYTMCSFHQSTNGYIFIGDTHGGNGLRVRFTARRTGVIKTILQLDPDVTTAWTTMLHCHGDEINRLASTVEGLHLIGRTAPGSDTGDTGVASDCVENIRVTNCILEHMGSNGVSYGQHENDDRLVWVKNQGLVDHCDFLDMFKLEAQTGKHGWAYGIGEDKSYNTSKCPWNEDWTEVVMTYDDNNYAEDCFFSQCRHAFCTFVGGRIVFRYNVVMNHEAGDSGWMVDQHPPRQDAFAGRCAEVYNNTLIGTYMHGESGIARNIHGITMDGGCFICTDNIVRDCYWMYGIGDDAIETPWVHELTKTKNTYVWNNTQGPGVNGSWERGAYACDLHEDTHFFYRAPTSGELPPSGYVKFQYPHPLQGGAASSGYSDRSLAVDTEEPTVPPVHIIHYADGWE